MPALRRRRLNVSTAFGARWQQVVSKVGSTAFHFVLRVAFRGDSSLKNTSCDMRTGGKEESLIFSFVIQTSAVGPALLKTFKITLYPECRRNYMRRLIHLRTEYL